MMTPEKVIYETLDKVYEQISKELTSPNQLLGVFLKGSQNYGLDIPTSDIDVVAVVLPSINDYVHYRPSKEEWKNCTLAHNNPNKDHIIIWCIDSFWKELKKTSFGALELLYTYYCKINPLYLPIWDDLIDDQDNIAFSNPQSFLHCIEGMMWSYRSKLEDKKIEFGTIEFDKFYAYYKYFYSVGLNYYYCLSERDNKEGLYHKIVLSEGFPKEIRDIRLKEYPTEDIIRLNTPSLRKDFLDSMQHVIEELINNEKVKNFSCNYDGNVDNCMERIVEEFLSVSLDVNNHN